MYGHCSEFDHCSILAVPERLDAAEALLLLLLRVGKAANVR